MVTRFGAVTSLGENAYEAAMAYRAGNMGLRESALVDPEDQPVTFCSVPTLSPWLLGTERLQSLLEISIDNLLAEAPELAGQRTQVILLLDEGLAEPDTEGQVPAEVLGTLARRKIQEAIGQSVPLEIDATGAAGFGEATNRIRTGLSERRYEFALLLSVHSDYSVPRIRRLSEFQRLYSSDQLDGIIPGEASVSLAFSLASTARTTKVPGTCQLSPAEMTVESARWDNDHSSFEAAGLTVAARKASAHHQPTQRAIGWLQSDVSFEMFRVYELQTVLTRLQKGLGPPQVLDTPCQRLGHLGASAAAWQVVYACEAFRRGFAPAPEVLCLAGSEGGARTAFLVTAAAEG